MLVQLYSNVGVDSFPTSIYSCTDVYIIQLLDNFQILKYYNNILVRSTKQVLETGRKIKNKFSTLQPKGFRHINYPDKGP